GDVDRCASGSAGVAGGVASAEDRATCAEREARLGWADPFARGFAAAAGRAGLALAPAGRGLRCAGDVSPGEARSVRSTSPSSETGRRAITPPSSRAWPGPCAEP